MNKTKLPEPTSNGFLNNPQNRAIIYQVAALLFVVFLAYYFTNNMFENVEKRGITTGFAFLDNIAGFGISQTLYSGQVQPDT
ncbi:hypothetical protein GCM10007916_07920 [Psychromonas marina]|uniref:Amino acid ABC transporter permease n=1 Tax=Psychromonas marina TaxID=88364 RepID=A0ABQ6DXB2_9GAMM|nr:hypothetical protein [Psychromonas marina]GLS89725.1 hypothetical protein GCM10007916_07920 [Psychromonas marina]